MHGRSEGFGRQKAHVHLHAVAVAEADFVFSLRDDVHQAGETEQMFDERLTRFCLDAALAGDQDVEVADSFTSAAQRSGGRNFFDARYCQQMFHEFFGQLFRGIEQESSRRCGGSLQSL